jgi:hypothetical protein
MSRVRSFLVTVMSAACTQSGALDPAPVPDAAITLEDVEIKANLEDPVAALAALALDEANAHEARTLWFYDTSELGLYDRGVIVRARKVKDGPDDSTVKARPMDPASTAPGWLELPGAKCETDRTVENARSACSLTRAVEKDRIDDVAAGRRAIASLYDEDQLLFLGSIAGPVALTGLRPLGPIPSTVWRLSALGLPAPVSLELWTLGDRTILEVSMRVLSSTDHGDTAARELFDWIAVHGLVVSTMQQNKTRAALESFVPR